MISRSAGRRRGGLARALVAAALALINLGADRPAPAGPDAPAGAVALPELPGTGPADPLGLRQKIGNAAPTVVLFALASLVPAGVLMATAFVRISIVLTLLRQALGSPQVPGNQVLMALALLLTALVMKPAADQVYSRGIAPFAAGTLGPAEAWEAGTGPIKDFMIDQIIRTNHQDYLFTIYDYAEPPTPGRVEPTEREHFPLRVVATAFLLSELTTALVMGFAITLPFLVIDLVVSAVLAAMGLFMLPPSLVALPIKLILFVLADGWGLVAGALLRSFA
jgi:flagellar biosynthetic protein FliP